MSTQAINHKNVQTFCRTCLKDIAGYSDIECNKYNIQETPNVLNWIQVCVSEDFQIGKSYPKYICTKCYKSLNSHYDFLEMCLQSARTLDKIFAKPFDESDSGTLQITSVKEEIEYGDNEEKQIDKNSEAGSKSQESMNAESGVMGDKALIMPIQTNFAGPNNCENQNETIIMRKISGMNKPYEYQNCSDISFQKETKHFDAKNRREIGIKANLLDNPKDYKHIEHSSKKCQITYKDTTSSKAKRTISHVKVKLNSAQEKNLKISRGKFQCSMCAQKFYKQDSLDAHTRREHQGLKPFQCDKCECGYNKAYRLKLHMNRAHGTAMNEQVLCQVQGCGKKFRNIASYKTHYYNKHTENATLTRTFICEDCGSSFKNMISLKKHRYKHGPLEAYPFHCEQCDKRFSTKYKYKQHQDRHAGIKNFECPYCGLKKTTNDELRTHINYHTKERQWSCSDCDSVFNSSGSLGQHFRIVHLRIRRHTCRHCGDCFAKQETLKHHEMRHTGEKPHECHICGKRFIQTVALRTHLKTHEKVNKK